MAIAINLGTFAEDATGTPTAWDGGYGTIWFGYKDPSTGDHYTWDGGTMSIEISDSNDVDGFRPLVNGSVAVTATENSQLSLYIPEGYLRAKMTGSSAGCNVQVRVIPRA